MVNRLMHRVIENHRHSMNMCGTAGKERDNA